MRILLSCHRAEVGGIQIWMLDLARSFRARGHACDLFFFDRGAFETHLPAEVPAYVGDLDDYLRLVRANRYDVVHACNMDWDYGVTAARRLGARLVLTCHGWVSEPWNSTNCDAMVSCAGWNATAQQAASGMPVRVIYNGIDLARYSPIQKEPAGPPVVAWVGRGGALEQKRIDRLAAVAQYLAAAGVRVRVADPEGPARVPEEVATTLRRVAEFWGPVAPDRMPEFFRHAAASGGCVLSTSTFEGLPLSLAEAQACGCPVIGPDVRGVNEAVDPRRGGVIHAPDLPPDAVARLVLDTLGDRQGMAARRIASRQFVAERFDHERMVEEYLAVYEQTLAVPQRFRARPSAGWVRSLLRFRSRAYLEAYYVAAKNQLRASEQLAARGEVDAARAAGVSALQTCPSMFLRPQRLGHLLSNWRGSRRPEPAVSSLIPATPPAAPETVPVVAGRATQAEAPATSDAPPLVSIIIPCYRQARYLPKSVGSALAQSHPAVEVIVVDDGSDDNTPEVGRSFGPRVRYLRRPNGGPAAARNTGIAEASGKYFLFLDADDMLHPDAVRWLVEAAGGREDVLCVGGMRYFERDDDLESGRSFLRTGKNLVSELLTDNLNPPLAFLCSATGIRAAGGFDPSPSVDACEDWEMWLRLVFAGAKVVPVLRVAAYYRRHPHSHSRNLGRMARSRAEVMYRTLRRANADPDLIRRLGVHPDEVFQNLPRVISEEHLHAGYHLRQQRLYRQAARQFFLSYRRGTARLEALTGAGKLLVHMLLQGSGAAVSGNRTRPS